MRKREYNDDDFPSMEFLPPSSLLTTKQIEDSCSNEDAAENLDQYDHFYFLEYIEEHAEKVRNHFACIYEKKHPSLRI